MRLGPLLEGCAPQCTVGAGIWQAAQAEGACTLVACVVAPGFDFADFVLLDAAAPLADWLRMHHRSLAELI